MENASALSLIKKIQSDLITDGLVEDKIIADLKKLREYALLEEKPVLVKAIRLTYEHIDQNKAFLIEMPSDEPIEEGEAVENTQEAATQLESLQYLISLFKDINNNNNRLQTF